MYRCPHCSDLSISGATQLSPPFDGRVKCSTCAAELKVKIKLTNFILPAYFMSRSLMGLLFHIHIDLDIFWEMTIVLILAFLQIRLSTYEEVRKP